MKVIGLTGGIGSGKSTVAGFLGKLGAVVIDTDKLWHEALRGDPEVRRQVVTAFGPGVLGPAGEIQRQKLGAIVFRDAGALDRLNGIMHPWMYGKVKGLLAECREKEAELVVIEMPLLLEVPLFMRPGQPSLSDVLDEVWVTVAGLETVLRRLEFKGVGREEAARRIASQLSPDERAKHADVIVNTDRGLAEVEAEVKKQWARLRAGQKKVKVEQEKVFEGLKFDDRGLIPAVAQDADTGEVLMLGYMNAEALRRTLASGEAWFYSRSRKRLWHKGETSGNVIRVRSVWRDCDGDTILVRGEPTGPVCHTGNRTCFFDELARG